MYGGQRGNDAGKCHCGGVRYHGGWCFKCGAAPGSGVGGARDNALGLHVLIRDTLFSVRLVEGYRMLNPHVVDEEDLDRHEDNELRRASVKGWGYHGHEYPLCEDCEEVELRTRVAQTAGLCKKCRDKQKTRLP